MPTKIEKDAVTGHNTTGHEWDGLRELNRPLPKWWLYIFYACIAWAVGLCVLYPSVPGITGYFHGVLGYSQRRAVDQDVAEVQAQRAVSMDRIKVLSFAEIRKDPQLLAVAETAGRITFANNCQPCHGAGGGGNPGYPALAAGSWLWGGSLAAIQQTVTHGIRSDDPDARQSQMVKFGVDGVLKPEQIQQVADYVMTLFGTPVAGADIAPGKKLFADNCAVCHGANGQGGRDVGAPRLASHIHLHGDTRDAVVAQVTNPKMGVMPNWNTRLDAATIKSVTLYVHSLGGGE
ncbi:MAG TPA: cytochrome-c oxidase, cbb3-type subunit III [Acetobacteraceae bacterium]